MSYKQEFYNFNGDLDATKDVKKLNMFSRLLRSINYLIWGDV